MWPQLCSCGHSNVKVVTAVSMWPKWLQLCPSGQSGYSCVHVAKVVTAVSKWPKWLQLCSCGQSGYSCVHVAKVVTAVSMWPKWLQLCPCGQRPNLVHDFMAKLPKFALYFSMKTTHSHGKSDALTSLPFRRRCVRWQRKRREDVSCLC